MDDEVNTCPLCLCDFKDPRALPCLHTFCQNCLSDVLKNLQYEKKSKTFVDCPTCREVHEVPANGVKGFRRNFYFTSNQEQSGAHCRIHKTHFLTLFCDRCRVSICSECRVDTHGSHSVKRIAEVKHLVAQKVAELKLMSSRMKEFETTVAELSADYDKMINHAIDNPVETVLENLCFESEVLEVRRSSLVVPDLRSEDKDDDVYDISDDDEVQLFGFHSQNFETSTNPPAEGRRSKPKKTYTKAETQTKSGSTKTVAGKSSRTATSTAKSASTAQNVNGQASSKRKVSPKGQGKSSTPVASTSATSPAETETTSVTPKVSNIGVKKETNNVTTSTSVKAEPSVETSSEKIIIPYTRTRPKGTDDVMCTKTQTNENGEIIIPRVRPSISDTTSAIAPKAESKNSSEKRILPPVRLNTNNTVEIKQRKARNGESTDKIISPRVQSSSNENVKTRQMKGESSPSDMVGVALNRPESTSSDPTKPSPSDTQYIVPVGFHVDGHSQPGGAIVVDNKRGLGFVYSLQRAFGNFGNRNPMQVMQVPRRIPVFGNFGNRNAMQVPRDVSGKSATVNVKQEPHQHASASTDTEAKTTGTVKQETPSTASAETQTQTATSTNEKDAKISTPMARTHKRKACGCLDCLRGATRKQKLAKTDHGQDSKEKGTEEGDSLKYEITYSSKQKQVTEKTTSSSDGSKKDASDNKGDSQITDSKRTQKIMKVFGLRRRTHKVPSPAEQRQHIKKLWTEGESPYHVNTDWLEQWKKYVGFDSKKAIKEAHPGPLTTPGTPKSNKESEKTTSVPGEVWDSFANWFGVA